MLETHRRTEFIVYLLNNADNNNRSRPQIQSTNQFKINDNIIDFKIIKEGMDLGSSQQQSR